jgi:hypothetical protein
MIAPAPVCFANHLSPTLWGRGTQVFLTMAFQDQGSSPPQSGGEVARAKPETERGSAADVPSRRFLEKNSRSPVLRHRKKHAETTLWIELGVEYTSSRNVIAPLFHSQEDWRRRLMIAPSPVCFANHLSPTLWGRGTQVLRP